MVNPAETCTSFAVEFIADNSGSFAGNGVRLATRGEAESYGQDKMARWRLVRQYRIVESNEPPNYAFVNGRLSSLSTTNATTIQTTDSNSTPA